MWPQGKSPISLSLGFLRCNVIQYVKGKWDQGNLWHNNNSHNMPLPQTLWCFSYFLWFRNLGGEGSANSFLPTEQHPSAHREMKNEPFEQFYVLSSFSQQYICKDNHTLSLWHVYLSLQLDNPLHEAKSHSFIFLPIFPIPAPMPAA